mmetsp:Transcript_41878/g.97773  ORF Transcript_41878/g.97773 Transcript_41878/m.97773 type:complete len:223 (-) Transcript_41878:12-680(-)
MQKAVPHTRNLFTIAAPAALAAHSFSWRTTTAAPKRGLLRYTVTWPARRSKATVNRVSSWVASWRRNMGYSLSLVSPSTCKASAKVCGFGSVASKVARRCLLLVNEELDCWTLMRRYSLAWNQVPLTVFTFDAPPGAVSAVSNVEAKALTTPTFKFCPSAKSRGAASDTASCAERAFSSTSRQTNATATPPPGFNSSGYKTFHVMASPWLFQPGAQPGRTPG